MRRAQATIELLAVVGAVALVAAAAALALRGDAPALADRLAEALPGHRPERRDDRWALRSDPYGPLIRRYVPTLVLERDRYGEDAAVPSDPAVCRAPWCAAVGTGRPVVFTHVVRRAGSGGRPGATFVEYWFYYPDSRTLHAPLPALEGHHRDDWEGLIVRIPDDGAPSARVTAHQWLVGAQPGWRGDPGWRPIPPHPVLYRAAGSHANGFARTGIDVPLDAWNGDLETIPSSAFTLIAADTTPALRLRYDPAASPPWLKALWRDPTATTTGRAVRSVRCPRPCAG